MFVLVLFIALYLLTLLGIHILAPSAKRRDAASVSLCQCQLFIELDTEHFQVLFSSTYFAARQVVFPRMPVMVKFLHFKMPLR